MQLNLKRALKLRKALEAHLARVELPLSAQLSLLTEANRTNAMPAIEASRTEVEAKRDEYVLLSRALASLRAEIAVQNAKNGVEQLLADIANIERQIAIHKKIAEAPLTPPVEHLQAEIGLYVQELSKPGEVYGRRPERAIAVAVVSTGMKAAAAQEVNELRRLKEELEDERTALNARTRIEIPEDHAVLLTKLGLI